MLKPELQSIDDYIDGIDNITTTQRSVALNYFEDGSVEVACPPLKALLHIMAHGNFEGKPLTDPSVRALFTREALLESDWYRARLDSKVKVEQSLWKRHIAYLEDFLTKPNYQSELERLDVNGRLEAAKSRLDHLATPAYRESLVGTIGADPKLVERGL